MVLRFIPFSRTYVSLISGMLKQDFYFYIFTSVISFLFWNTIFICLGVSAFINFGYIINFYEEPKMLILIIVSVSIVSIISKLIFLKRGGANEENNESF
jgi:membrane protein DedA with SNARE-associated domain